VSLDDFGTGHSSLSRLHQLPLDKLKIDQSFVRQTHDPRVQAILRAVIDMSRALGLEVIFEGVETSSELEVLQRLGGRIVQGYIVGKPASRVTWTDEA
jgi:EAL domain-containing protein (putative c-di-GMP-specific phosphodiesterase class I)